MSVSGFEVGADIARLQQLSADQQQYLARFRGIMSDLHQQANDLVTRWEGGNEEYKARADEFNAAFEMANRGFAKMIDATDGAVDGWSQTRNYLNDLFT
ncbi:WXG100 family type VII secretion target [Streptomonospora wellingtoniae]|uniref:WXG100 family type VII secretion target n=1 Tax=Streptomonospora wellingtoniae TaxID=3075544 RepID=A0ABU2KT87_9ACTN|nr:hypothetical protein [Streptomonospora sp. DSM 45055]MDT0302511.1 hypothetical protein [Streptomonospora sp. DSM 45055]